MEKEFVTYELAIRMKQLGFDEPCFGVFFPSDKSLKIMPFKNSQQDNIVAAPTFSQAFRWFRENFNLINLIGCYPNTKKWYSSYQNLDWSGKETIEFGKTEDRSIQFETYEEAELACLEKLIEIVEKQKEDEK